MTVPVSNMTATFANTDYRYDAIGMDANTFGQYANTTLLHLKANGESRFQVDIDGNLYANGSITANQTMYLAGNIVITGVESDLQIGNTIYANNTVYTNNVRANTLNTINLTTTGINATSIWVGSASVSNVVTGQQTVWVPAKSMSVNTTEGATANTWEAATNDVMASTLDFSGSANNSAQFSIQMPKAWDTSTGIIAQFVWSHPTTTTNFGVVWEIAAISLGNSDAYDASYASSAVQTTDTGGTTNDIFISPESTAVSPIGASAAEELVTFRVRRYPAHASDTMTVIAQLHGVKLHYTVLAASDD